jgi:hypothetical protein
MRDIMSAPQKNFKHLGVALRPEIPERLGVTRTLCETKDWDGSSKHW